MSATALRWALGLTLTLFSPVAHASTFFPLHPSPSKYSDYIPPYGDDVLVSTTDVNEFDWTTVEPSQDLRFVDCYDSALCCARLVVPLDWLADDEDLYNHTITLAVIKRPAKVQITDTRYGGPIITNPGGPGGSGIISLLAEGELMQNSFDDAPHKYFDVVSFDPRGVLLSTPNSLCFPDNLARLSFLHKYLADSILDSGDEGIKKGFARAKSLGQLCAHNLEGPHAGEWNVRRFISTASTARDMLHLVERLDELRRKELESLHTEKGSVSDNPQEILGKQENSHTLDTGLPKLQYYGVSYGTILGNTFASLFPERVGRMILDGVCDADDYMQQGYTTNLQDTELVVESFYKYCFLAGPSVCEMYDPDGPVAIENAVQSIISGLNESPAHVVANISGSYSAYILTYSDLRLIIFGALYEPLLSFPFLSKMFDELRHQNYTTALSRLLEAKTFTCPSRPSAASYPGYPIEAPPNIFCADGVDVSESSISDFRAYLEVLKAQSPTLGASWARNRLACTGWQIRPKWRFEGPFGGETAHPILWVGNTADPVTPLRNAHRMAALFPGSMVLQQDSEGHGTFGNGEGNCTISAYQQYFHKGVLPEKGTICAPSVRPFGIDL